MVGPVNGQEGSTNAGNVIDNDLLNGQPVTPEDVNITPVTQGPITIGTDGVIIVAPNTPAGTYTVVYTICDANNPGNCATGTVTVEVGEAVLVANPDVFGPFSSANGIENGGNVLDNDFLNGMPVTSETVNVTPVTQGPVTVNADGTITVAPNTPAGTYTVTYTICEVLNPSNCTSATVTVEVVVDPQGLVANPDFAGPIVSTEGSTNAGNVTDNDSYNGQPVTPGQVTVTPVTQGPVTIGTDGTITVAPNAPAGTYTVEYTVCIAGSTTECATGTVTVEITAAGLVANPDIYGPISSTEGSTNAGNVLDNDFFNGQPVAPQDVTITPVTEGPITVNADGTVTVAPNTPAGTYTVNYTICGVLNPANCATASVTVTVESKGIITNPDFFGPVSSVNGSNNVGNVLDNDFLNGQPVNQGQVTVTPVTQGPVTVNAEGTVTVAPNTPAGTYTVEYTVCISGEPNNCSTGVVTVTVEVDPEGVVANPDFAGPVNGQQGLDNAGNVLDNDRLNGQPANTQNVTVTPVTQGPVTVGTNGVINVAPNTPAGTYVVEYTICETGNTGNCSTTTVTVEVIGFAGISITKTANVVSYNVAGSTITYTLTIRNTSNVNLVNVIVTDPLTGFNSTIESLATGEVRVLTTTYTITEEDLDNGRITNTASVTAQDPNGNVVQDEDSITVTAIQSASIALVKEAQLNGDDECARVGNTITYTFRVTNTGSVSLRNVVVTDAMLEASSANSAITFVSGDTNSDGVLNRGEEWIYRATYIITQEDVDAGNVINQAFAEAVDNQGVPVGDFSGTSTENDTETVVEICQQFSIELEKMGMFNDNNGDGTAQVGETISYNFTVVNTGSVTLYNVIVTDPLVAVTGGPVTLTPGEVNSSTFTAVYTITQEDIDEQQVVNQASVSAQNVMGMTVEDLSDDPLDTTNVDLNGNGDADDPTIVILPLVLDAEFEIFNGITPNGDGKNDYFRIAGIERYPENTVIIFNRWGVKVFERDNYRNEENGFRGVSEGRVTIQKGDKLPSGTYYYIIRFTGDQNPGKSSYAGYLYVENR